MSGVRTENPVVRACLEYARNPTPGPREEAYSEEDGAVLVIYLLMVVREELPMRQAMAQAYRHMSADGRAKMIAAVERATGKAS